VRENAQRVGEIPGGTPDVASTAAQRRPVMAGNRPEMSQFWALLGGASSSLAPKIYLREKLHGVRTIA